MRRIKLITLRIMIIFLLACLLGVPVTAAEVLSPPPVLTSTTYPGVTYSAQLLQNIAFTDIEGHWAKAAITRMAAQSVIRGKGNSQFRPGDSLSKEEALTLVVRILGLETRAQRATGASTGEKDQPRWSDGYLAVAVEEGILSEEERVKLIPARTKPAERQEVAAWVARALGLAPLYGPRQQAIYNFKDWQQVNPAYLPLLEAVLQEGLMVGASQTSFAPRDPVKRGEMAVILERINPRLTARRGLEVYQGEVTGRRENNRTVDGAAVRQVWFEVQTTGGRWVYLLTEQFPGSEKDFVVYKGDRLGRSPMLAVGDAVQVTVQQDGVALVEVTGAATAEVSGTMVSLDPAKSHLTISDPSGQTVTYPLSPFATVTVDRRDARLEDLLKGQEVSLTLKYGQVSAVRATLGDDLPGYQPSLQRVVIGRIREIRAGEISVLNGDGSEQSFRVSGATGVFRGGTPLSLKDLKVGDPVKLYVTGDRDATRVEIAAAWGEITSIIKGRLEKVNTNGYQLALSGVSVQDFDTWLPLAGVKTVEMDPAALVYVGERLLEWSRVSSELLGQEVYVAVAAPYGKDMGIKVTAKSGEALSLNGPAQSLSWGREELRLEGESLPFHFGPGTIVVKNGRLVEAADLSPGDHLFVVANRDATSRRAVVITSREFYPSSWQSYRGLIDRVREDDFRLERYSQFDRTGWEEASGSSDYLTFTLSWEARVIDATGASPKTITPEEFYRSRFTGKYEDEFVYLVSRQGRVEMLVIYPHSTRSTVTKSSLGRVKSATAGSGQLVLESVQDYSEGYQKWMGNPDPLNLKIISAIIVRDNHLVGPDELKDGDRFYVVHDQQTGLLLFAQ